MSEKIKGVIGSKKYAENIKQYFINKYANIERYAFTDEESIYYIDENNGINLVPRLLSNLFDIIDIICVIEGDEHNGDAVIKTLIGLGGINKQCFNGKYSMAYYFIGDDNNIKCEEKDSEYFKDKIIIKIPIKYNTFKAFDRVIVRDAKATEWFCDIFSHYNGGAYTTVGGITYKDCIPYEGNEDKVGKITD